MHEPEFLRKSQTERIIFFLSLFVMVFWCSVMLLDIYYFTLVGVFYEIMWLPMLLLIYALPIIAFVFWINSKFDVKTLYFYSFLPLALTALTIWICG